MLGSRANDAYRSQIQATLHAASVDEVVGDELRRGRLTREITGSSGFPDAPGLTLVPDLEPAAEPKRKPPPPKRTKREGSERQDAARAAAEEKAKRAEQERIVREEAAAAERERQRVEAEAAWQAAQDEGRRWRRPRPKRPMLTPRDSSRSWTTRAARYGPRMTEPPAPAARPRGSRERR